MGGRQSEAVSDVETALGPENTYLELRNLFELSDNEKANFKEQVAKAGNTVQILVHTNYEENAPIPEQQIDDFLDYVAKINVTLAQTQKGTLPTIIFIESPELVDTYGEEIERYRRRYQKVIPAGSQNAKLYFVRTFQDNATPCYLHKDDLVVQREETEIDNWNEFGKLLADLGVKNVLVRGRNMIIEAINKPALSTAQTLYTEKHADLVNTSKATKMPGGCVGDAIVQLDVRGFMVLPSKVTFPDKLP